jgi:hypothetical protein
MTKGCNMQNDYYVYEHRRESDGSVFYVGMGTGKRFKTKDSRNIHWKRIVAKHGFNANIVASGLSIDDAYKLEIALIKKHGKQNLCNITDGGDGVRNPTQETRQKMRAARIGKPQSKDHVEKRRLLILASKTRSNSKTGLKGVVWHNRAQKWAATASLNGKHIHIGLYVCTFAAWKAAMKWRLENA